MRLYRSSVVKAVAQAPRIDRRLPHRVLVIVIVTLLAGLHTTVAPMAAAAHPTGASDDFTGRTVVIASETSMADTAAAVSLAASDRAAVVVLAAGADALGDRAAAEIAREHPERIVLVGGEAALSPTLQSELVELVPEAQMERIAGSTRIGTSLLVLRRVMAGGSSHSLVVVHGWTPADMAHGAAVVASGGADGLLLAGCGALSDSVATGVDDGRLERVVLVGKLASTECPSGAQIEELVGSDVVERHEQSEPAEILMAAHDGQVPAELRFGVIVEAAELGELVTAAAVAAGEPDTLVLYAHRDRVTEVTALTLVDWYPESLTLIGSATWLVEGISIARNADAPGVSTSRTVYQAVEAGNAHICGLLHSGQIECWGDHRDDRTAVPEGTYQAVSAGFRHSCAIKEDRSVTCWGRYTYGRTDAPSGRFLEVAAGWQHSCGITEAKRVRCWGRAGATYSPGGTFTALSAGGGHTCGLRTDGRVACWGANGDGESSPPSGRFLAVEVGFAHSCGIRIDGRIVCWGAAVEGQTRAPAGKFVDLSLGQNFGCALDEQGSVQCWGANRDGEGSAPRGTFVDVEVGGKVSCALRDDGRVTCWGFRSLPAVADVILP